MSNEIRSILKTCSTCKTTFPTIRDLIKHESEHHPRPNAPARNGRPAIQSITPIGDRSASDFGPVLKKSRTDLTLASNSNVSIGNSIKKSSPVTVLFTNAWTEKITDAPIRQTIVNRWVCEYCLAEFRRKDSLRRHQLSIKHHGVDWKLSYFCSKCDKGEKRELFKGKEEFEEHMAMVHGESSMIDGNSRIDSKEHKTMAGDHINSTASSIVSSGSIPMPDTSTDKSQPIALMDQSDQPREIPMAQQSISTDQSVSKSNTVPNSKSKKDWLCKYCLWSFSTANILLRHQNTFHDVHSIYCCRFCPRNERRTFAKESKFYAHLAKEHGLVQGAFSDSTATKKSTNIDSSTSEMTTSASTSRSILEEEMVSARIPKLDESSHFVKEDLENSIGQHENDNIPAHFPTTSAWRTVVKKEEPIDEKNDSDQEQIQEADAVFEKSVKIKSETEDPELSANTAPDIDLESTGSHPFLSTIKEELDDSPSDQDFALAMPDFIENKSESAERM